MSCNSDGKLEVCYGDIGLEWTLNDVLDFDEVEVCSSSFSISDSKWFLRAFPEGVEIDDTQYHLSETRGWLSVYLVRNEDENSSIRPRSFTYTFGLKRKDGTVEKVSQSNGFSVGGSSEHGFPKFIERSVLHKRRSELLPSGALTITLAFRVNECFDSSARPDVLSDNLANMFDSQKDCDLVIIVCGTKISAHKFIVSARSPVFAAMLEDNMKEKNTGVVNIEDLDPVFFEDCDPDFFEDFVRYLYTGRVDNLASNACVMYRIADKYDVKELKCVCSGFLRNHLTLDNICDAAVLSNQFKEEESLGIKVREFFKKKMHSILLTKGWRELLEHGRELANELLLSTKIRK